MKRPAGIVYGVNDVPPMSVLLLGGLQHVGLVSIFLLVPLIAGRQAGLAPEQIIDVLSLSMLVLAVGPILQSLNRGPVGCGFLCPPIFAAAYLPASILAIKAGGLPLMFGMTIFAGIVEMLLSRLMRPLRPFMPPEIAGFVVAMIGLTIGVLGMKNVLGVGNSEEANPATLVVAAATLSIMVGLNVWAKGAPKLFCALIGMVVGYLLSVAFGILPADNLDRVRTAPIINLPAVGHISWAFDPTLIVPFVVAAVAACLRAMGDITICQKSNDTDWIRPDLRSISGGMLANGMGTLLSGMFGTVGLNTSTSNVGLASATGITSRYVALSTGAIFLLLVFLPKAATIFAIMPAAVVGATLMFAASMVFINGLLIITSRMLDSRRIFVIGLSFMVGLSADIFPSFFSKLPAGVQMFTGSSLVLGTFFALALNLIFRIGSRRTQTLIVDSAAVDTAKIDDFVQAQGASWGARRDIVDRARFNLMQSVELIVESGLPQGNLALDASFDEFNLNLRVSYDGEPLELADRRPSNEEIIASEEGHRKLAGYMLRRHADSVQVSSRAGRSTILFHFDH